MVKNPPAKAGDTRDVGLIPGSGNGNPSQYSCLGSPLAVGVWWAQSVGSQRIRGN